MIVLFLLMLLQERPIEATIGSFLKGDAVAQTELVKLGAFAIRPLQKARGENPDKIDALIRELKVTAAYPSHVRLPDRIEGRKGMTGSLQGVSDLGSGIEVWHQWGIPVFSDRFDSTKLTATRYRIDCPATPLDLIEALCRQTGLDYGYFHNAVVIGTPERLWRLHGPAKESHLDASGLALARGLVEKLGDESIEVRDAAARELMKLGSGVLPVLWAQLDRKDPVIVAGCKAIIRRIRPPGEGVFGPASCLRQRLSAEDQEFLKILQTAAPKVSFIHKSIAQIMADLQKSHGVNHAIAGDHGRLVLSMQVGNQSLLDVLSLITQSRDLDLVIRERRVVIDSRDAIERSLAGDK